MSKDNKTDGFDLQNLIPAKCSTYKPWERKRLPRLIHPSHPSNLHLWHRLRDDRLGTRRRFASSHFLMFSWVCFRLDILVSSMTYIYICMYIHSHIRPQKRPIHDSGFALEQRNSFLLQWTHILMSALIWKSAVERQKWNLKWTKSCGHSGQWLPRIHWEQHRFTSTSTNVQPHFWSGPWLHTAVLPGASLLVFLLGSSACLLLLHLPKRIRGNGECAVSLNTCVCV